MSKQPTLNERMAVMEKLHEVLSEAVKLNGLAAEKVAEKVLSRLDEFDEKVTKRFDSTDEKWDSRFDSLEDDLNLHKQDYAALKNKGIGIAATISVMFTGLGFLAAILKDKIAGVFG